MQADGALIHRPADAGVDKEKGTCSSVSLVSGRASAQTARPATSIATLRCETVTDKPATDSRTPSAPLALAARLPHFKGKAVTVSSRLFRSLRLLHNRQLTVLVYAPQSPEGKIITREP